jgi:hypothetical protein
MMPLFILLVVFQFKHWIADYILQGRYQLGKFRADWGFALPLLSHCAIQGAATLAICLVVRPELWWLAVVDVVAHFAMDRIKAGPKYLGRFKALSGAEFERLMPTLKEIDQHSGYIRAERISPAWSKAISAVRSNRIYWVVLGLDAMFHHLTDLFIVWVLVS